MQSETQVSLRTYFDGVKTSLVTYYQSAALISIAENIADANTVNLLSVFSTLANLNLPMTSVERGWCPIKGLTAAGREGLRALKVFFLILVALLLQGSNKILHKYGNVRYDPNRYRVAVVSIAALTFTSVASSLQKLFTCQEVPGRGMRISIDMTQPCSGPWWGWWVALLWFAVNSCPVLPAMALGLSMLRDSAASVSEYTLCLILPLPSLAIWIRRKFRKTDGTHKSTGESTANIPSARAVFYHETSAFRRKHRLW
jgi:hypothetical protein